MSAPIPYDKLLAPAGMADQHLLTPELINSLEEAWLAAYWSASTHESNVLKFQDSGFTFLFDQSSAIAATTEDRLVVGYGFAVRQPKARDASRMRGFLGGGIEIPGKGTFDKGHVLAHAIGGGMDVNLFPQRPELNRGRSAPGKRYRQMERYAADHPGVFVFSRLLYSDPSWVPTSLEYGIWLPEGRLWVEQFAN